MFDFFGQSSPVLWYCLKSRI